MSSFSKVIQPKNASFFTTHQPLRICSFDSIDDNETIGASIPIPGLIDTTLKCSGTCNLKNGFAMYIKDLHLRNASLIRPSNYEYNLANLMNLHFDAINRRDFIAANRLSTLINQL
jgi:hypothetical protein